MDNVTLTINGCAVDARAGESILEAALRNDIYIPHLCFHPDLEKVGVCRLCLVEVEGRGNVLSCRTNVEQGLVVKTETPALDGLRRVLVELIIVNHEGECLTCPKNNQCKLQQVATYMGIGQERMQRLRRTVRALPKDTSNPFFDRDPNKCVLCGICVRTCEKLQGVGGIDFAHRGYNTVVSTFAGKPLAESNCESCGECLVRCPTGALTPKNYQQPSKEVKSVCPYCGVGCSIFVGTRGGKVVNVRGNPDSPVNHGSLCVKGRFGYGFIHHPERLASPLVRKDGKLVEASWDEALTYVAEKLHAYKGDQFVAIASAKCTNEDNYVLQKFARGVMGTNNLDHCARL